ncbi:MAG: hypothetical protein DRP38_07580 [Thermotogae bacterium]|nr:MAG: hypothetical protein B5M49_03670 [Thermotoga sp. 4484_232]RKX41310.1 MAG: hypothetical protein DRP23_00940 [Thermotogota bacterium]RKX46506.1 MAG: hypothetical protein DRP38_07580 [Thermotogota bacterium]RKX54539.1 MAG: hypothetical protein DRP24_06080 [Thermotoga sp.]
MKDFLKFFKTEEGGGTFKGVKGSKSRGYGFWINLPQEFFNRFSGFLQESALFLFEQVFKFQPSSLLLN